MTPAEKVREARILKSIVDCLGETKIMDVIVKKNSSEEFIQWLGKVDYLPNKDDMIKIKGEHRRVTHRSFDFDKGEVIIYVSEPY